MWEAKRRGQRLSEERKQVMFQETSECIMAGKLVRETKRKKKNNRKEKKTIEKKKKKQINKKQYGGNDY